MDNLNKNKILLSKLTNALKENQWLKVSKDKYKPVNFFEKNEMKNHIDFKPVGSYYSKGSWLFHNDMCCNIEDEIVLIEVDYKTVYKITGKELFKSPMTNSVYENSLLDFTNKYGIMQKFYENDCNPSTGCFEYRTKGNCNQPKTSCKWKSNSKSKSNNNISNDDEDGQCIETNSCSQLKTEKDCKNNKTYNCYYTPNYKLINWSKLYNKYNGFTIYPYPEKKMLDKFYKDTFLFKSYDVETLVLWNHEPVIKYHNLGTIKKILLESGLTEQKIKDKSFQDFYKNFIKKLIEKIHFLS